MGSSGKVVAIVDLIVGVRVRRGDSAASVAGLVRWAQIVGRGASGSKVVCTVSSAGRAKLSILAGVLVLAAPEVALRRAGGVVVGRAWTIALLLLVVASEEDLHNSGEQEEEGSNKRDSECSSLELACGAKSNGVGDVLAATGTEAAAAEATSVAIGLAIAKGSANKAIAGVGTVARHDRNSNHSADEEDIKYQSHKGEEGDATEAASQDHCEDGVQDGNTRKTLDGLVLRGDGPVAISKYTQEVRVDAYRSQYMCLS